MLLPTSKFAFPSPLSKKRDQSETLTLCSMVSVRGRLIFFGNLQILNHKITALREEITLKAPSGEWIYK